MSSLLVHCHGENWKSPTRSFGRSGKAKRTFTERKRWLLFWPMVEITIKGLGWRCYVASPNP